MRDELLNESCQQLIRLAAHQRLGRRLQHREAAFSLGYKTPAVCGTLTALKGVTLVRSNDKVSIDQLQEQRSSNPAEQLSEAKWLMTVVTSRMK